MAKLKSLASIPDYDLFMMGIFSHFKETPANVKMALNAELMRRDLSLALSVVTQKIRMLVTERDKYDICEVLTPEERMLINE